MTTDSIKENIKEYSPIGQFLAIVSVAVAVFTSNAQDTETSVLSQRVSTLETYFVTLDARERQNRDSILLMLTELKGAISRIEGKLEK